MNRFSDNLAFEFARDPLREVPAAQWRAELKKKVAEVQERKRKPERPAEDREQTSLGDAPPAPPVASGRRQEPKRSSIDPQPMAKPDSDVPRGLREFHAAIHTQEAEHRAGASARMNASQREQAAALQARARSALPAPAFPTAELARESWLAGKSILLTRTLSGLIDLVVLGACVGLFLFVSIQVGNLDALSLSFLPAAGAVALFFHFDYSLCFLALSSQTVGMMLTGLKLVDDGDGPIGLRQAALSSAFFLLSWLGLGSGLLWGLWDSRARCLHDVVSRTRVVRC